MATAATIDLASKENEMTEPTTMVVDPVCGMTVDPDEAIWLEHDGRTYYFCEPVCIDTFRDEPGRWLQDAPATNDG